MYDYLTFQLYGAMASWGEMAPGGVRHSALYPSKSALIGLIAAALGIKREQETEQHALANSLVFGVKVLSDGTLLRDFHTSQVPGQERKRLYATREQELNNSPKLNTILSTRDYRVDAYAVIAVSVKSDGPYSLAQIQQALLSPKFTLYLGRKSCPLALPLHPQLVNTQGVRSALDSFDTDVFLQSTGGQWLNAKQNYYAWEGEGHDISAKMTSVRQDMPISRKRWQFAKRSEHLNYGGNA